jgi:hypothetical protein
MVLRTEQGFARAYSVRAAILATAINLGLLINFQKSKALDTPPHLKWSGVRRSVFHRFGVACQVMIAVAEQRVEHRQALEIVANFKLVGHAHAAV